MVKTGLQEFKETVSDFRSVTALALNSSVAAPLVALVMDIGPPWPTGAPIITSFAELIVLITIFHFWYGNSRRRISKRMVMALVVLCVGFVVYMALFDSFTFSPKGSKDKDVRGFVVQEEVRKVLSAEHITADDALRESEYDPNRVWEPWSVTTIRIAILTSWLILFVSLSVFVGTFVMYQRKRSIKMRANPI